MTIELDSEQQQYQRANESRERAEREHDASLCKPVTEQDLDEVIEYVAAVRDCLRYRLHMRRTVDARLLKPVVLPSWMTRTLNRRKELAR